MTNPNWREYGKTIKVEGGIKAQSTRGAIGESWWSRRFLSVLESFAMGGRLTRGRSYARAGQVLSMQIAPGAVTSTVQGSRPTPYRVSITLPAFDAATWTRIEEALAAQAIYLARLLAGEMPGEIEEVFTAARAPLFPTKATDLTMACSCPDWGVPCKHIAATFYLLAEAFDADPFEIMQWRGRDRETLLANLRELRGAPADKALFEDDEPSRIGAPAVLSDVASPDLGETLGRFWVAPVPLPARPPTLLTDPQLILRQLPAPAPVLGGPALIEALRGLYAAFEEH